MAGNHGTVVGGVSPVHTEVGRAAQFDGVTGYIDLGVATDLQFDTEDFTISVLLRTDSVVGVFYLIDNFDVNDDGWAVRLVNGVPWISLNTVDVIGGAALTVGVWHHVVFVCDRSGNGQVYIDGAASGAAVNISSETLATANSIMLGSFDGLSNFFPGAIAAIQAMTGLWTADKIKADYATIARTLLYEEDFSQAPPTLVDITANQRIPGTEYTVASGSWAVKEELVGGRLVKWIECTGAGRYYRLQPFGHGSFEDEIEKGAGGNQPAIAFIHDETNSNITATDGAANGYVVILNTSVFARVMQAEKAAGVYTDKVYTDVNYVTAFGTRYALRTTRSSAGEFTAYIKGGVYTNWTLVDPSGGGGAPGTNPFTDLTTGTSIYKVYQLGVGDRHFLDRQYLGVYPPT